VLAYATDGVVDYARGCVFGAARHSTALVHCAANCILGVIANVVAKIFAGHGREQHANGYSDSETQRESCYGLRPIAFSHSHRFLLVDLQDRELKLRRVELLDGLLTCSPASQKTDEEEGWTRVRLPPRMLPGD
jgi:hypothetical protein